MSCYLDSNVLIYLSNKDSVGYDESRKVLLNLVEFESLIFVSSLVWDEMLYSIRNKNDLNLSKELSTLFRIQYFKTIPVSVNIKKVVSVMERYNLRPRDAFHLVTAIENKSQYFTTFDNDFEEVFKKGIIKQFKLPHLNNEK